MSTLSYLPKIKKILNSLPTWQKAHSFGSILVNTLQKVPDAGEKLALLGSESISDMLKEFSNQGFYQQIAILNACSRYVDDDECGSVVLDFLSEQAEHSPGVIRDNILRALGKNATKKAMPLVRRYLADEDPLVADSAELALTQIDPHAAMASLISSNGSEISEKRLLDFIDNLYLANKKVSLSQLNILLNSEYTKVKVRTLDMLVKPGCLNDERFIDLLSDASPEVKSKALRLLSKQPNKHDYTDLYLSLLYDKNRDVLLTAQSLLARKRKNIVSQLIAMTEGAKGHTLDALIHLLAGVKEPNLVSKFGDVLGTRCRKQLRVTIIEWLLNQDVPTQVLPYLEKAMKDETSEVVDAACKGLVAIGSNDAGAILVDNLMSSESGFIIRKCLNSLNSFPASIYELSVITLVSQLNDDNLKWVVLDFIKDNFVVSAIPVLKKVYEDESEDIQEKINETLRVLEHLGGNESVEVSFDVSEIRDSLSSRDQKTRLAALDSIQTLNEATLVMDVEKLLLDDDDEIRHKASIYLNKFNVSSIVEKIRSDFIFVSDKDKFKFAQALSEMGDESDINRIEPLLCTDVRHGCNQVAVKFLKRLGMNESEIEHGYSYHKLVRLLRENTDDSIRSKIEVDKKTLIFLLEKILDNYAEAPWEAAIHQLNMLNWQPKEVRFIALREIFFDNPKPIALESTDTIWFEDFICNLGNPKYISAATRMLVLSGNSSKRSIINILKRGYYVTVLLKALDGLSLFSREEVIKLANDENFYIGYLGRQLIIDSPWDDKIKLLESVFYNTLNFSDSSNLISAIDSLIEVSPSNAKICIFQTLEIHLDKLSDRVISVFAEHLEKLGGSDAKLVLIPLVRSNQPYSKAAFNALNAIGWEPVSSFEKVLAALYSNQFELFEALEGEVEILPLVLKYLTYSEKNTVDLFDYLDRCLSSDDVSLDTIRLIINADWEDGVMYKSIPAFLKKHSDIATDVLLEILERGEFYEGANARFVGYISEVGNKKSIPFLLKNLSSRYDYYVKLSAKALGRLNHAAAVPMLDAALSKVRDKAAYSAIVKAIASIGDENAVGLLESLLPGLQTKTLRNCAEKAIARWNKLEGKA